ncbi:MAG: AmmeMemoRadiSam system protein B [Actinomycetia bacterium]|nr:AmmeMemoRadiSam system protein B [Actinomycetes bacterium]
MTVRPPAVAGMFYPGDPRRLRAMVTSLLEAAPAEEAPPALGFVVPHAGYIYSGSTAALAYAQLRAHPPRRLLLLGPAHRVRLRGLALSPAQRFATPLGEIQVDEGLRERLAPHSVVSAEAHAEEHSLEVQLPFLQVVAPEATVLPVVVGSASQTEVADAVEAGLGPDPDGTLLLISSDLSHYHPYEQARRIDQATITQITAREPVGHEQACGATPLNGALEVARRRGWRLSLLGACSSGDTAGDHSRVVGYASVRIDHD